MTAPLLAALGVHKRLGRRSVLAGVDLAVAPGEVVGVCGENGAGKTTLLRVLTGVLAPDAGVVRRPARLGYAPQTPLLYEQLTVWEHCRYFAAARGLDDAWCARAGELLARYRFETWRDQRADRLSGGTRQKLNLTLALLPDPEVLVLDEPYDGFEWETYLRFWDHVAELRAAGRAVVIVSHLFHDRARLDRVLELRLGTLGT